MDPRKAKPLAAIILASAGKGDSKTPEKDDSSDDPGLDSASEEILQAIDDKDPKALKDSLKSFFEMCDTGDSYSKE